MTIVEDRPDATGPSQTSLAARKAMIDSQLRVSGVNAEWVLKRMMAVPREDYVPENARGHAYCDRAIPLADGRKLAAPLVQGMMLEEAAPKSSDKALVVDGGSGYLAELLRPLVASLEVLTTQDAVTEGAKGGDFSLLVIDGAIEQLPSSIADKLAEGARIITGTMERGVSRLSAGRKIAGHIALAPLIDMAIPELSEFAAPKGWSF